MFILTESGGGPVIFTGFAHVLPSQARAARNVIYEELLGAGRKLESL